MRILLVLVSLVLIVYLALCVFLYSKQDELIFLGAANDASLADRWRSRRVEIPTPETTIEGWWAENPNQTNNAVVLYFAGNAEDVLYTADMFANFEAKRLLVTNYRGYGATPGTPSEQALFNDAVAIYDYAIKQPGVSAEHLFVAGRSLGSAVASYVAANRPIRGAILITPYDSMASVAQGHYPLFPVRLLLRHRFDAMESARKAKAPMLILAGERDDIIPPIHAQHLYDAWLGPKTIKVLADVGHNDIAMHSEYLTSINRFLIQHQSPEILHRVP